MILRAIKCLAIADIVDPAIADMRQGKAFLTDIGQRQRSSHTDGFWVFLDVGIKACLRVMHGLLDKLGGRIFVV